MLSLTDYSPVFNNPAVKMLAANGCLVSEDGKYILVQRLYGVEGQILNKLEAPTNVAITFDIYRVIADDNLEFISEFQGIGSPAQAYNYAVHEFQNRTNSTVPNQ